MNEVSYIFDTTLQPQDCFGIRILMSNLRPPLMKIISTPLIGPHLWSEPYQVVTVIISKYMILLFLKEFFLNSDVIGT